MSVRIAFVYMVIGSVAITAYPSFALAKEDPETIFAQGRILLQQGDFDGALQAFTHAARTSPKHEMHRQQAALLQRVIKIRERFDQIEDSEQWLQTSRALHTYYHDNKIYTEALNLDQQVHERLNNAESAAKLARTQLALKLNADVVQLISDLDDNQVTPETTTLYGIALARQGRTDEAKALANEIELSKESAAELAFDFARLQALIDNEKDALKWLASSFKSTLPSRLEAVKIAAQESPDFSALAGSDAFAAVLKTESQVKESGCSSGKSCGKCPSRSKCSSANNKEKSNQKP